jgi:hypothetical protein
LPRNQEIKTKEYGVFMKITITEKKEVNVKYLKALCGVRYWEDAIVNGKEDEDGNMIPCRVGDCWSPLIDIESGKILNWKEGTLADIHYKVCDAGVYTLLDDNKDEIKESDGYVPDCMCPEGNGYGDYVIMKVDKDGKIANWSFSLDGFEEEND